MYRRLEKVISTPPIHLGRIVLKHSWTSNNISLATIPPLQWLIVSCLPLNDGSKICRPTVSRDFQRMILIRIEYSTKPSMMPFPTRTLLAGVICSEAASQNTGNSVLRYTTKICNLATTTLRHCGCARPWMRSGKYFLRCGHAGMVKSMVQTMTNNVPLPWRPVRIQYGTSTNEQSIP